MTQKGCVDAASAAAAFKDSDLGRCYISQLEPFVINYCPGIRMAHNHFKAQMPDLGEARTSQEQPGAARSSQEQPGAAGAAMSSNEQPRAGQISQ